ncbi:unnamed protein product [marine sediment metagenome]|uniref:Uncharacterized protein n=1 Tax=marine sediment metagenome TaxID=412755 RepID=X0UI80_9ZZZZ
MATQLDRDARIGNFASATKFMLCFNSQGTLDNETAYISFGGYEAAAEAEVNIALPFDALIRGLRANVHLASGDVDDAVTLRVAGASTGLTCTIVDPATAASDLTHQVYVTAGQLFCIMVVAPDGTNPRTLTGSVIVEPMAG